MVVPDAELPEVRLERDAHLAVFRGREGFLRALDDRLADPRGGYVLLLGGPGQGKSALACALARRCDAPLHLVGSHRNPARFIPSLLAQARARSARPEGGGGAGGAGGAGGDPPAEHSIHDVDDLRSALVAELDALARARGGAVVVIDALDELDDPAALAFLPIHLPPKVHVVLTARPDLPIVSALQTRVARLAKVQVPPLDASDVLAIAGRLGADPHRLPLASLLERTGGNALLVTRALAAGGAGGELDPASVASSLEELFDGLHRQIDRRGGDPAARVVQLLAVARAPLSPAALGAITGVSLPAMRELIDGISELLHGDGHGAFKLWHRGFADHVRRAVLGENGERDAHLALASWALRGEGGVTPYGLAHGPSHLVAAGQADEARALTEDVAFLERRLCGDAVAEAILDLDAVGSPLLVPVRRHAHWLVRRPGSLRAVLDLEGLALARPVAEARGAAPSGAWIATRPALDGVGSGPRFVLRGHGDEVPSIAVDRAGQRVASASADGTVRVWDIASTRLLASARVSTGRALSVAWSHDGLRLACGTDDRGALLLDADDLHELGRVETRSPAWAVLALPGGALATGSRDGEVRIWDEAGEVVWQASLGGVVASLALSPDGTSLAASGTRGRLVVWSHTSPITGRSKPDEPLLRDLSGAEHETIWSVAFADSPRGIAAGWRLVAASSEGRARVVDGDGWEALAIELPDERLFAADIAPRGDRVAVGGTSGRLRVFRLPDVPEEASVVLDVRAHGAWLDAVAFLPDGDMVLTSSVDRTVRAFALEEVGRPGAVEPEARPTSAALSHLGDVAAVGAFDGTVTLVDAETGSARGRARLHEGSVTVVSFAPSGRLLVSGSHDGTVVVSRLPPAPRKGPRVDAAAAPPMARVAGLRGHEASITAAVFSAQEGQLATASRDRTVRVWTLFGARELACLPVDATAHVVAFSPDGDVLACATAEGTVFAWAAAERFAEIVTWPVGAAVDELFVSSSEITVRRTDGSWWARPIAPALDAPRPIARASARSPMAACAGEYELVSGGSPRGAALAIAPHESVVVRAQSSEVVAAYPVALRQVRAATAPPEGAAPRWIAIDDARFYLLTLVDRPG